MMTDHASPIMALKPVRVIQSCRLRNVARLVGFKAFLEVGKGPKVSSALANFPSCKTGALKAVVLFSMPNASSEISFAF